MEVKKSNRDPATPPEVTVKMEPRKPEADSTLGIAVAKIVPQSAPTRRNWRLDIARISERRYLQH